MIFDGKAFAKELEQEVKDRVQKLGKKIKIVSVIVGDDPASVLYTKLKKAAAERVGIEFEIVKILDSGLSIVDLIQIIKEIGERKDVTGVMVQLPLPDALRGSTPKCLAAIPLSKDVDGLRWKESGVIPATARAVMAILDKIVLDSRFQILDTRIVVIGSRGAVGEPLTHFLRAKDLGVSEVEWDTPDPGEIIRWGDVIVSCVGKAGVVTGDMVSDGSIAIDVGMSEKIVANPKFSNSQIKTVVGDMTQEVYQKAPVAVPVPGGVGPVTIACLMLNAVEKS